MAKTETKTKKKTRLNGLVRSIGEIIKERDKLARQAEKQYAVEVENILFTRSRDAHQIQRLSEVISKCRTVVIRLMFQHYLYDPIKLFTQLNRSLPRGALVIIIEEDDSFFQIYPDCKAYWREVELQSEYAKHTGMVRRFEGKKIPYYAGVAGLNVEHSEIVTHTNTNVGTKNLMNHFIKTLELVNITLPEILSEEEMLQLTNELLEYVDRNGDKSFFLYPNVLTVARTR